MDTLDLRVARKRAEAEAICSFELVADDGAVLPPFEAGAHIDVHLPGGLVRPYSLCNPPHERHRYVIGVLREPASRGGSATLHEQVQEGQRLRVAAPRNRFALADSAPHHLLVAGGIGITPLLAMAEALHAQGASFALHHTVRTRSRAAFVQRLAAAPWAARSHLHVDDEAPGQRIDIAALLDAAPPGTHVYACGPAGLIEATLAAARARGWPDERLHHEFFTVAEAPHHDGEGFEVQLASSGRVVPVAAGQSIVHALEAIGVFVPTSCEQGVCGTCLTRVQDGVPDHCDRYLTPEEQQANDQMLLCCSRARSARLVLDL